MHALSCNVPRQYITPRSSASCLRWLRGCVVDDDAPTRFGAFCPGQVALGHRYIADTLGAEYVPQYAWHIDPFGISATYAAAWAQMNYSAWVFNRIDTRLKDLWHGDIPNNTQAPHLQFRWTVPTDGVLSTDQEPPTALHDEACV